MPRVGCRFTVLLRHESNQLALHKSMRFVASNYLGGLYPVPRMVETCRRRWKWRYRVLEMYEVWLLILAIH